MPEHLLSPANKPCVPRRSPPSFMQLESPKSQPQYSTKIGDGTPKGHKPCRCKQSKCLKLYCECFASGAYCDGCSCADCHNNVEKEEIRTAAMEIILERSPSAFRPKFASTSYSTQADGDAAEDVPMMVKHNKGCHCRKTGCLKKYCECFQANIHCSENCKCIHCKNLEGCGHKTAISQGECANIKSCIKQTNATAVPIESSGCIFPQESRKRKSQAFLDSNKRAPSMQKLSQHQQMTPVKVSSSFPVTSVNPVCHIVSPTAVGFSKFGYRSLLADIIHPVDTRELCSLLVVLSEAAKFLAEKNRTTEMLQAKENQRIGVLAVQDMQDSEKKPAVQKEEGEPLPFKRDQLLHDEKYKSFIGVTSPNQNLYCGCNVGVYKEQERLVLTCLRDCLGKLITFGSTKAGVVTESQSEHLSSHIIKAETEI